METWQGRQGAASYLLFSQVIRSSLDLLHVSLQSSDKFGCFTRETFISP